MKARWRNVLICIHIYELEKFYWVIGISIMHFTFFSKKSLESVCVCVLETWFGDCQFNFGHQCSQENKGLFKSCTWKPMWIFACVFMESIYLQMCYYRALTHHTSSIRKLTIKVSMAKKESGSILPPFSEYRMYFVTILQLVKKIICKEAFQVVTDIIFQRGVSVSYHYFKFHFIQRKNLYWRNKKKRVYGYFFSLNMLS